MSLSQSLSTYHSLEFDAHLTLYDIILKAVQESYEFTEALEQNDSSNSIKEAGDLLINILSVTSRFGDIDKLSLDSSLANEMWGINKMLPLWLRDVSNRRKRYTRDTFDEASYLANLSRLVSILLERIKKESLTYVVDDSIVKFRTRIAVYLPEIELQAYIAVYPDFPKPGILFRDIAPLLSSQDALRYACFELARRAKDADIIAGLDARGFIFGTMVAHILEKPFVMIRKKWKLPWETIGTDYSLEYGDNSIEIQKDAIEAGKKVVIVDDLLATGGTFLAAASLIEKVGGKVEKLLSLISIDDADLASHPSRKSLEKYQVESVLHYKN